MLSTSMIVRSKNNILPPQQHSLQEVAQMTLTYSRLPANSRSIPAAPDKSVREVQHTCVILQANLEEPFRLNRLHRHCCMILNSQLRPE